MGKIKRCLLNILGDIKVYRFPMFIIYDPTTFAVKGYHTRQAINALQPGDIVMRGYSMYLDGFFIPGEFSHSSIYVGDNTIVHAVAEGVQTIDVIDFLRCDRFCIMRPKDATLAAKAVKEANSFIGTPYDFDFVEGTDAFYCHEMTAECYSDCDIAMQGVRILGFKCAPRYTCDSFLTNGNFEKIMEVNPKKNINFTKQG